MHQFHFVARFLAAAILACCGAAGCGGSGGSPGPVIDRSQTRGALFATPPNLVPIPQADGTAVTLLEPQKFGALLEAGRPGITGLTGTPKCAISTYYMKYATVGGAGEATDATGAIMVPSGTDPACHGPRPVLLYAHGPATEKSFNMANLRDNAEAVLVAVMYAAQGFIVVAPNYAGYDTSALGYHPYLNAGQQASDMIDALRAARKAFGAIGASDGGTLVLAGYSQGGHVAMATQRAMQTLHADEFSVSALAGMSGPYAMALLNDRIFAGAPNVGASVLLPMSATSWKKSYGGMYSSPNEMYEDGYATGIEDLLPSSSLSQAALFAAGKLPPLALFAENSLPGPASAAFGVFFGERNLIRSSFRSGYLADMQTNPCNLSFADPLDCAPKHAFRKAGVRNDLRTYVPKVPVLLCGGSGDPTVFFASTEATAAYFQARGMPAAALTVLDLDSAPAPAPAGYRDPYAAAKAGFAQARTAAISAAIAAYADPAAALAAAYHDRLVPPFCMAAARGFFASVLAH